MKKSLVLAIAGFAVLAGVAALLYALFYFNLIPQKTYTAEDFGIQTIRSDTDADGDGVDDYTDFVLGARAYLDTKPVYKSAYYEGGYPPAGEGVCTDVIWQAFRYAGYSLKDMVDADIEGDTQAYPSIYGTPDPQIDFRRVRNLRVFFERHALSLTLDLDQIEEWQPGDIAVFPGHIGIVSDKRNKKGIPYLLHHGGRPVTEENALERYEIIGHYRWTANPFLDIPVEE